MRAPAHVWSDPKSLTSTLLILFLDQYGGEAFDDEGNLAWHPETIALEVESDTGVSLSDDNFDKLMAGLTLLTTDLFWKHLPSFVHLCNVMAGLSGADGSWDAAEPDEMAWAITEAYLLDAPEDGRPAFSREIGEYVVRTCLWEGLVRPPSVLRVLPGRQFDGLPETEEGRQSAVAVGEFVRGRLGQLAEQLDELPLSTAGRGREVADRIRKHFLSVGA